MHTFGQTKLNLSGTVYANALFSEDGTYLEEYHDPVRAYHLISIKTPKGFLVSNEKNVVPDNIYFWYELGLKDTTWTQRYYGDSAAVLLEVVKDSIPLFTPFFYFQKDQCLDVSEYSQYFSCPGKHRYKYFVKLAPISRGKMSYKLYYAEDCEAVSGHEDYLLRYGTIKLRKGKRKKWSP
jgi:hypothetical protein